LRARRERRQDCGAAEKPDELAAFHSITNGVSALAPIMGTRPVHWNDVDAVNRNRDIRSLAPF
jgi:hypothetical protein